MQSKSIFGFSLLYKDLEITINFPKFLFSGVNILIFQALIWSLYILPLSLGLSSFSGALFSNISHYVQPPERIPVQKLSHGQSRAWNSCHFLGVLLSLDYYCLIFHISDFGVDHLVMSMCRVFSFVVGRECLL